MTTSIDPAALQTLSGDLFEASVTSDTIDHLMQSLGLTDAHIGAFMAAEGAEDGDDDAYLLEVLSVETVLSNRRWVLGVVGGWLPVPPRPLPYAWAADLHLEDTTDDFPGMRPEMTPWWDAALGWNAFRGGRKHHGDAIEWFQVDPSNGWLAFAAGLSLDDYRALDTPPANDTLWTLVGLTAHQGRSQTGHERAARRVLAARQVYLNLGGDPEAIA
jgi:hypothetical protein